jgi:antitoxin component YwqK of YwqJK toxin-antitoxin module
MKRFNLFLIFALAFLKGYSQKYTDPEYYPNGDIMKRSVFDSTSQKWKITEYYIGGAMASERFAEKNGLVFTDDFIVFYTDGKPVYKTYYKNGLLTGAFIQYYQNGKICKQGEYYNFFKTGVWTEYYENGKKKNEGKYLMSAKDSTIKEPRYLKDRILMDTIIYPDVVIFDNFNDSNAVRKDILLSIPTLKDGVWQYWDERGDLLREENYTAGVLHRRKK